MPTRRMGIRRRGSRFGSRESREPIRELAQTLDDSGISSELAFHIDWILHAFDPDLPSNPEPCSTAASDSPDDIAGVSLVERQFACISFRGKVVAEASPEEALQIWREQQPEPVSDSRFEQVSNHILTYVSYEQSRFKEPEDPAHASTEFSALDAGQPFQVAARLVRLAMRAEESGAEMRQTIYAQIRQIIANQPIAIDGNPTDAFADPDFLRAAHRQQRGRLIRDRAQTGAQLSAEERARITLQILLLEEEIRQLPD